MRDGNHDKYMSWGPYLKEEQLKEDDDDDVEDDVDNGYAYLEFYSF